MLLWPQARNRRVVFRVWGLRPGVWGFPEKQCASTQRVREEPVRRLWEACKYRALVGRPGRVLGRWQAPFTPSSGNLLLVGPSVALKLPLDPKLLNHSAIVPCNLDIGAPQFRNAVRSTKLTLHNKSTFCGTEFSAGPLLCDGFAAPETP